MVADVVRRPSSHHHGSCGERREAKPNAHEHPSARRYGKPALEENSAFMLDERPNEDRLEAVSEEWLEALKSHVVGIDPPGHEFPLKRSEDSSLGCTTQPLNGFIG
jgi:hypothetical protein